jgi:CRP-like cAMP-binding protein
VAILLTEKDRKALLECDLFSECDPQMLLDVLESNGSVCRAYSNGAPIRSPEHTERGVGIILSGRASVTTPNEAHTALLRFLGRGETFGIANLFSNDPFISIIRADGECRVCHVTEGAIRRLLETDSGFLYRYLAFLSGRIRYLNRKIGFLTAGSAEQRLALYLASFGGDTVHLTDSISSLSELLDVGRASLYRAFDRLSEDGFIRKEGRSITLLDREGMQKAYH